MAFRKRRPRYKWMYERQRRAKRRKAALIAVPVLVALACAAAWLVPRVVPVIARFRACKVGTFYTPVEDADNAPFRITLKQAKKRGAKVVVPKPGEGFDLGGARVEFLGPRSESEDINNMSLVCRVTYGNTSFLFGGDAEREEEEELVKAGAKLRSDVLKVNHHGSNSSSCEAFLKKVRPRWAVISTGRSNDHPSQRVLDRLRNIGAAVLRTDQCGTICISTDGKKITVSQFGEKS